MLCCPYCSMLSTILFSIVTPNCGLDSGSTTCSVLLTTLNNVGSTALFNPVFNNLQHLVIFTRVVLVPDVLNDVEVNSEASPTIWSCYANLNRYHYSFLKKLILIRTINTEKFAFS